MRSKLLIGLLLSVLSFGALADGATPPAATANASASPDQVVQQTAKDVFESVNAHKAELQKDPQGLYELVGKILLPRFDCEMASR